MKHYLEKNGEEFYKEELKQKEPIVYIQKLMEFDAKINEIVEKGFENDISVQNLRDTYFEKVIEYCSDLLAQYCHE